MRKTEKKVIALYDIEFFISGLSPSSLNSKQIYHQHSFALARYKTHPEALHHYVGVEDLYAHGVWQEGGGLK